MQYWHTYTCTCIHSSFRDCIRDAQEGFISPCNLRLLMFHLSTYRCQANASAIKKYWSSVMWCMYLSRAAYFLVTTDSKDCTILRPALVRSSSPITACLYEPQPGLHKTQYHLNSTDKGWRLCSCCSTVVEHDWSSGINFWWLLAHRFPLCHLQTLTLVDTAILSCSWTTDSTSYTVEPLLKDTSEIRTSG